MITSEDLAQAIISLKSELKDSQEKTNKQMRESQEETSKLVKALSQNIDGVNKSIGQETEEFFFTSLQKNPTIGNIDFDYVYRNQNRSLQGRTQEIDILLENGKSVAVVEVKNKISIKSIEQLDKIMENFDFFHKDYDGYRIIGALAGKIFPKHLQSQALEKGYSVLTQQGDHIEQINPRQNRASQS